jgi:beta-N-acetylhexosaminidase
MYYLYDAPLVPVYINTYTALSEVQEMLVRKLMSEEPLEGLRPWMRFVGRMRCSIGC